MRLPALALSLALLATACGGDGDADTDDAATDVCDRLPLADASRIVGVDYTVNAQRGGICFYSRAGTDQAFALRVIGYDDDYDQVVADSKELGYTASPVEVAGADRAVALAGQHRSVVAEQDGAAFEVTFNGDVAVAQRLMAVVLDGKDSGPAPAPVADPCDALDEAEVRRLLGVPAEPRAGAADVALKSCTWRKRGRELVVAAARGRGPVGEFWDENFFVGKGADPERLRIPGADGALLVSGKGDDVVGLAVAAGDLSYVVTVGGAVADARAVASQVARVLLGSH